MIALNRQQNLYSPRLESILAEGFEFSGEDCCGYPIYLNGNEALIYDPMFDKQIIRFQSFGNGKYKITGGPDK